MRRQYADSRNLSARAALHERFSTNPTGWLRWVFDHIPFPGSGRILELGAATGGLWSANADRLPAGLAATISDLSPGMVEQARENLGPLLAGAEFRLLDAENIDCPDESFDLVIANHMLYHVDDLDRALGEIRRVLRPGGHLVATTVGLGHMKQLRELLGQVVPRREDTHHTVTGVFCLETGPESLGGHFVEVRRLDYRDHLEVTDPQAVVDYVLSTDKQLEYLTENKLVELGARVAQVIEQEGGMRIDKSSGMLRARRQAAEN